VKPREALADGARGILGRSLTVAETTRFEKYIQLLVKWQRVQRLVGSTDPMWIVEHLILDSLLFLRLLPPGAKSILDLGSGAGLPGLPIKIVWCDVDMTLIESRRRRASFLTAVVRELRLEGVHVAADRVEDREGELAGRFDAVVMRCAGDVDELIPLASGLVVPRGLVIASGPPRPKPLAMGEWVTVPGARPGSTRRSAVHWPGAGA
jgi:16S rRNA (guanine527-N7)-methyltransferase